MIAWLTQNLATILTGAVLLAAAVAAILYLIRAKKRGKSACGCGCSQCPMNGECHSKQK